MKLREEFIKEMVELYEDLTTSDLQGIIEARCLTTGENDDELLEEIYAIVNN